MKRQLQGIALAALTALSLQAMADDSAAISTSSHSVAIAKVTDPATVSLLATGLIALGFARRRAR